MNHDAPAYGLWGLVLVNSAVFIIFAFSFFKPRNQRDWRTFGTFSAFIVALFVEMYGFPLTIYLLSGWIQSRAPGADVMAHDSGHLWYTLLGWKGDPHGNPVHILANVLVGIGFFTLASAWRVLHAAQRDGRLATTGLYSRVRHPQYVGFALIMFGFLMMWPTILTLAMFPVLLVMYWRLGRSEEREAALEFGAAWEEYASRTPALVPRIGRRGRATAADTGRAK